MILSLSHEREYRLTAAGAAFSTERGEQAPALHIVAPAPAVLGQG